METDNGEGDTGNNRFFQFFCGHICAAVGGTDVLFCISGEKHDEGSGVTG